MAQNLASIYGTEADRVHCSFFYKIGACIHGERCSRQHIKPQYSETMSLPNLYQNPAHVANAPKMTQQELDNHFSAFYEDIFMGLAQYGEVTELMVCDNACEHLLGNVYVRFDSALEAKGAVESLVNRWYGGRPIYADLSNVTDFREARCREFETRGTCRKGSMCNFVHMRIPDPDLVRTLFAQQRLERRINPTGPVAAEQAARRAARLLRQQEAQAGHKSVTPDQSISVK